MLNNVNHSQKQHYGVSDFICERVHLAIGVGNWQFPFLMEKWGLLSFSLFDICKCCGCSFKLSRIFWGMMMQGQLFFTFSKWN